MFSNLLLNVGSFKRFISLYLHANNLGLLSILLYRFRYNILPCKINYSYIYPLDNGLDIYLFARKTKYLNRKKTSFNFAKKYFNCAHL